MTGYSLRRCVTLLLGGALAGAAAAQPMAALAPLALPTAAQLCKPADPDRPLPLNLQAEQRRVQGLLNASDKQGYQAACDLAWATQSQAGIGSPAATAALVPVLEGMVQQAHSSEELLRLAAPLYQGLAAARPDYTVAAARLAGTIALLHDMRHEMDSAMGWSLKVQRVLDAQPDRFDAYSLWSERINHALRLIDARQFDAAHQLLQTTLVAIKGQPDLVALHANALSALSGLASRQFRLAESAQINQEILALRLAALPDDRAGLALAYHNVAVGHHREGRYDQAEAMHSAAIAAIRPGDPDPDHYRVATYTGLGSLLLTRGRGAEALAAHESAYALLQASGDANTARAAEVLFFMASAQISLGRWGDAARTLRLCLARLENSGQRAGHFSAWGANMLYGQAMVELGDLPEAQAAIARAQAQVTRAGAPPNQLGHLQMQRSAMLEALGQAEEARQALIEAEAAYAKFYPTDARPRLAVQARRCRLGEAALCEGLKRLLADADGQGLAPLPPDLEALICLALAQQLQRQGEPAAAQHWALRAIVASHLGDVPGVQWPSYMALATALDAAGQRGAATVFAKRAVTIVQGMRSGLAGLGAAADAGFLRNKHHAYRSLADWLMQAGRFGEALEVLAQLKATEQDDFAERATAPGLAALSLTPEEQNLLAQLDRHLAADAKDAGADAKARRWLGSTRLNDAEKAALNQWLKAKQAARADEVSALQALLAHTRTGSAKQSQTVPQASTGSPLAQASRPHRRDVLHAHLVWGEGHLNLLTLSAGSQGLQRLPLDRQRLDQDIAGFIDALQQRGNVLPWAQLLYRQVGRHIDAAASRHGATQVKLWLDGGLRYLPFAALHDGRQYLVQKYQLVLAPALLPPEPTTAAQGGTPARPMHRPKAMPPTTPSPPQLTAFGVSRALPGYAALPGVGEELCGIVKGPVRGLHGPAAGCGLADQALGSGTLVGEADLNEFFTEQRLRSATTSAAAAPFQTRLLHIGTHFVLRPGNISRSWLLLGDGQPLRLDAMRDLALRNTALVTLSACQTGLPGTGADGIEVDGLPATLLSRGARRVMASLWKVDDLQTAALMRRFYAELSARPGDFAGALQAAQQASLRGQGGAASHPFHWAAFNLTDAGQ